MSPPPSPHINVVKVIYTSINYAYFPCAYRRGLFYRHNIDIGGGARLKNPIKRGSSKIFTKNEKSLMIFVDDCLIFTLVWSLRRAEIQP